ncbi:preprotein translocase subunit YajC [Peptoniphilus sp.]|uniref:preprotein translocase subunit YajC n=1 Tax=Peptoniphilus sp. TaxID=1971214 RepID=UPI0039935433
MNQDTAKVITSFLPLIILMVFFYFFLIKPQKKKEKEIQAMRENVKVGDNIITIGGIVGKVIQVKDDVLVIETSGDKTKYELMKWGINSVLQDRKDLKSN